MIKIEDDAQEKGKESPYKHASFFMKVYFCWLLPFLRYGYKNNLEQSDVYDILHHDTIQKHSVKLEKEWEKELKKQNQTGDSPSLGRALFRIYRLPMLTFGFISTIEECVFKVAQPVLLSILVQYFGNSPAITRQQAYLCAGGIGFCSIMLLTTHHFCWFVFSRTGMHMRISVTSLVYKKALKLSNTAFQKTTVGQIVNLLSNDVNRFDRVTLFLHYLWIAPIQIITMLAVLWYQMGPLSLVAISTLLLLIPVQAFMAKMFSNLRAKTAVLTDERVRIMNEIISANKVIKVHGWEKSFTEQVKEARRREVRMLLLANVYRSVVYMLFLANRPITTAVVFITYAFVVGTLSVPKLILTMLLVDIIGTVSGGYVSVAVQIIVETGVSLRRLKSTLYFRKETKTIRKTAALLSVMRSLARLSTTLISGATFLIIALLGHSLDLSSVFLIVPLVNVLSHNFVAKVIGITRNVSEFVVTLERVKGMYSNPLKHLPFPVIQKFQIYYKFKKELRPVFIACILQGVSNTLYYQFAIFMSGFIYVTAFLAEISVGVEWLFLVMVLTRNIKHSAFRMLPLAVRCTVEGNVAVRRLQQFLLLEEIETLPPAKQLDEAHSNQYGSRAYVVLKEEKGDESEEEGDGPEKMKLMEMSGEKEDQDKEEAQEDGNVTDDEKANETEKLLQKEEQLVPQESVRKVDEIETALADTTPAVKVENLSGSWKVDNSNGLVLDDISFSVQRGELLAIVGPVGCGKSSLLMALLEELPSKTGESYLDGKVAYASQQPWLFSGTFQQNIIFAEPFNKKNYWEAVSVCALNRDIANLPEGDLTLVGERGVQLSGGQKARVSLARAVYSDADIYLLDDPLSAVDTAVGRHLFDRCIKGTLRSKAVVLITHQLQYLNEVDKIIILKEGKVTAAGSYKELVDAGVDFAAIVSENESDSEKEEVQKEEDVDDKKPGGKGRRGRGGGGGGGGGGGASPEDMRPEAVKAGKVDKERKEIGTVGGRVYWKYLMAGTAVLPLLLFMVVNFTAQGFMVMSDWWLTNWAYIEEQCVEEFNETLCLSNTTYLQEFADIPAIGRSYFILVYAAFLSGLIIFGFLRTLWLFFIWRILNRFAKDIGFMDEHLPPTIADFNQICVQTLSAVIVVCIFNPLVIILVVPLGVLLVFTRSYYLASSRDIKRIEAVARSPVFTHLSASLQGLAIIRAYGAQHRFINDFHHHQDNHTKAWMMFLCVARWFGVMLDSIVTVFVIFVAMASVVSADCECLGFMLMTSTERVIEYGELEPEAPLETDHKPEPDWPKYGNITFEGVSLKYSEDSPIVLKGLHCSIRAKEKIGIVGRTGAGKSSLTAALLRLVEPSGLLKIDGEDVKDLGLHVLRRNIAYIPQDPVLFRGTLRRNLDPFSEYADDVIWETLKEVQLHSVIEAYPEKLEMHVVEEGKNYSVGQRQLLCLARAILRKNRILIIDEATANVDFETDQLIQATVREKFKECTVLTIAHRLNTIMDSDRVLVMEEGRIIEFDEPFILLQHKKGILTRMVNETGTQESARLWEVAKNEYKKRYSDDPYKLLEQETT
ncbi:Multidrug resistance-associated protein 4 [Holothuria leucospilota]|uniref:Multidrug resistance-associated protein 4 n=1 Tax=Holothuria leucospilota TaxID=206669 RepID=A0A9Q1BPV3_HOLLE|nr:Multidrug resistance-associated protein 4 [Holothuria leucospilota]